jgi:hypothetical protein
MAWRRACVALSVALLAAPMIASAAAQVASAPPAPGTGRDSSSSHSNRGFTRRTAAVSSSAILAACEQIDHDDLLRIHGDFGTFEGIAAGADSTGVFGLRSRNAVGDDAFSGQLEWNQIRSLEIQRDNRQHGVVMGAITAAAIGLTIGTAAILLDQTGGNTTSKPNPGWVIAPTVLGAVIGASIGGSIGASERAWHRVYP